MPFKLPISLEKLLRQRQVEGERIECKAGWNRDAILRTSDAGLILPPFRFRVLRLTTHCQADERS